MKKVMLILEVPDGTRALDVEATAYGDTVTHFIQNEYKDESLKVREYAYEILSEAEGVSKKIVEIMEGF